LLQEVLDGRDPKAIVERESYSIGTVRKWASGDYKKTADGWVPVPGGGSRSKMVTTSTSSSRASAKDLGGGGFYSPDPTKDSDGDGISDASRVGVPGRMVLPPPKIPRLPGLPPETRAVEEAFASLFEDNTEEMVDDYLTKLMAGKMGEKPGVFSTDDAKLLSPDYAAEGRPEKELLAARARCNLALHQTANALAKRAFIKHLDTVVAKLPTEKRRILVTSGGVAAGKGFAIKNVKDVSDVTKDVAAVWDAAGEQNGTENPWILEECVKRGINPIFVFVHSNPETTWENPKRGVVQRASEQGRMVDALLFADSYDVGAKNFAAFVDQATKAGAVTAVLDNSGCEGCPRKVDSVPPEALKVDSQKLYRRSSEYLSGSKSSDAIKFGGSIGRKVWHPPHAEESFMDMVARALEGEMVEADKKPSEKPSVKSKVALPKIEDDEVDDLTAKMIQNVTDNQADPKAAHKRDFDRHNKVKPFKKK
jgi:hypothetical protein